MIYHEMNISQLSEVAVLYNELAYFVQRETQDPYWDFGNLSVEEMSRYLQSFLEDEEKRIFVAQDGEKVVGLIACEVIQCHLPISSIKRVGYIAGAFVSPEYRGKGVMRALEKQAAAFFKKLELKYVELDFISNNHGARKNWEALGYRTFREQARKQI